MIWEHRPGDNSLIILVKCSHCMGAEVYLSNSLQGGTFF